jgi:hypothetical protein
MKNHPHLLVHVQHQCQKYLHHFFYHVRLCRIRSFNTGAAVNEVFNASEVISCCSIQSKETYFLARLERKRYHLREAFDETAVVAHKTQEGLNLNFIGRPWPFPYSSAFFSSIYNPLAPTICPRNETGALVEGTF